MVFPIANWMQNSPSLLNYPHTHTQWQYIERIEYLVGYIDQKKIMDNPVS